MKSRPGACVVWGLPAQRTSDCLSPGLGRQLPRYSDGNTPDEALPSMMEFIREAAEKIARPPAPPPFEPKVLRDIAAIQEAVGIEKEVRKGADGNSTVVSRADLLRRDVWDRWRAGQGLAPVHAPLTEAIGKLADIADRQLALLEHSKADTIHRPIPNEADRSEVNVRRDPPIASSQQPAAAVSSAPLFSQIEDEYVAIRQGAGASDGAISTIRTRAQVFKDVVGDRPLDRYMPIDLQNYVNLLQYLPVQYNRDGENHEMLRELGARQAIEENKKSRNWETLGIKTMQDGYVQVVKAIISRAVGLRRLHDPFAGYHVRWPDDAKPSVRCESIDYEKLDNAFRFGVNTGYLDDAMLGPLCLLSTRRIGILPFIRGCDFDVKHGVDITRVNGIVFDKENGVYRRVPYKTNESLRFFVLNNEFRRWGFTDWARSQGDNFIFRQLQNCKDPSDAASKRMNRVLKRGGAAGMNVEVVQSMRHGGKDMLIEEDVDSETTRLQMGHETSGVHAGYGSRAELRRKQCQELANLELPKEIDWSMFEGLDFEAMAARPRRIGRPQRNQD